MNLKLLKILFSTILLLGVGCQEESIEIVEPPVEEAFKGNSVVADLIKRVVLHDGSSDNIIDHASCFSVDLPVTVIVNGQELRLEAEADYLQVEKIFDEFDNDEDVSEFLFPVSVLLSDYSQVSIHNGEELEALVDKCIENGEDDDIECIDFNYPLELSVYDVENQLLKTLLLKSDRELFLFFNDLDDTNFVVFTFPITLLVEGTGLVNVIDNEILQTILEEATGSCDEDDDEDYNDDDVDGTQLEEVLSGGSWIITYFFETKDKTPFFADFHFTFAPGGEATALSSTMEANGSWGVDGNSGHLILEASFDHDLFDGLNGDWIVSHYTESEIQLFAEGDEEGAVKNLTLQRE